MRKRVVGSRLSVLSCLQPLCVPASLRGTGHEPRATPPFERFYASTIAQRAAGGDQEGGSRRFPEAGASRRCRGLRRFREVQTVSRGGAETQRGRGTTDASLYNCTNFTIQSMKKVLVFGKAIWEMGMVLGAWFARTGTDLHVFSVDRLSGKRYDRDLLWSGVSLFVGLECGV